MSNKDLLLGLTYLYNPEDDTTSVSWAYRDDPDLKHFVLEVWDDAKRKWVPYDNRMGIIQKDNY